MQNAEEANFFSAADIKFQFLKYRKYLISRPEMQKQKISSFFKKSLLYSSYDSPSEFLLPPFLSPSEYFQIKFYLFYISPCILHNI